MSFSPEIINALEARIQALESENRALRQQNQDLMNLHYAFKSLIDSMPHNVFGKDLEGRFMIVNQSYCQTEGKTAQEILGKTDFEMHPSHLAEKYRADDLAIMESGRVFSTIEKHQALMGAAHYVQVIKAPLYDEHGQTKGILGIFWDISELMRMQESLQDSEERYHSVISVLADGLILQDRLGNVITMNPSARQILGLDIETVNGLTIFPPHYQLVDIHRQPFRLEELPTLQAIKTGQLHQDVLVGIQIDVDSIIWLSISAQPLLHSDMPYAVVTSFKDISMMRQAQEQALSLALEQARVRLLAHFIQDAAHEFIQPLTVIKTQLFILERGLGAEDRAKTIRIHEEISHLQRLLKGLSKLTKLDTVSQLDLRLSPLKPIILSATAADLSKPIERIFEYEKRIQQVFADPSELSYAISQIYENAVQHTPDGGTISIKTFLRADKIIIDIADSGLGMEESVRQKIFERFYRADEAHTTRGMGLGLAIAKRIIDLHQGWIEVDSEVGHGSSFRIVLPQV